MSNIDKDFKWNPPGKVYSELQERYAGRSTYELAERVKKDGSAARRGATEMKKLFDQFVDVLSDEQLLALKAAVSVANKLAAQLDQIKPWAKAYEKHLQDKSIRESRERPGAQVAGPSWLEAMPPLATLARDVRHIRRRAASLGLARRPRMRARKCRRSSRQRDGQHGLV